MKSLLKWGLILQILMLSSCDSDRIGEESLYTFTDKLVGQYIDADSTLTEFAKLIEKTKVKSLLNSYGQFTCFAPTNEAMFAYYQEKGKTSLDDFPEDSLRIIVYDHLINGAAVNYVNFNVGRLFQLTMSDRYLSVHFDAGGQAYVNQFSKIMAKDVVVHNGVIHTIDKVLDPVRAGLAEVVAQDERFSIFYTA